MSVAARLHDHFTINNTTVTGDQISVGDMFQRMDQFKVGHFEIFKMLVISLVSMFEFVGCTLEDVDYLSPNEGSIEYRSMKKL